MRKNIFTGLLLALPWLFGIYFVSLFLQMAILGDNCHNDETSALFDLFYDMASSNGYHPFPSNFNFMVTVVIPALFLGYWSAKRFNRHEHRNSD